MRYTDNFQYKPVVKLNTKVKKRYFKTIIYPTVPLNDDDIYVITVYGDRLDLLAWQYYNNAQLWWILSAANPDIPKGSVFLDPNTQVRIPRDYTTVLLELKNLNETL
jgi:hypothetical protein